MGITLHDIINLRKETIRQNRTSHKMCVVINRETAVNLYRELVRKGLTEEFVYGEDKICKCIHNSMYFGAVVKVKGEEDA